MAQPNLAQLLRGAVMKWDATHPASQYIDPQAELAIASHEGLSGGIGDNGHAFGPNQENDAGGVLTGRLNGLSPQQKNAWAWSPAGLADAFSHIAGVAGGEHGAQAVRDIATRFERPANVGAEITDALAHYQGSPGSPRALASVGAPASSPSASTGNSSSLLGQLLAQTNAMVGLNSPGLADLFSGTPKPAPAAPRAPITPATGPAGFASLDGVKVDLRIAPEVARVIRQFGVTPTSGLRTAEHNAQVGGAQNSDHLRGDAVDFAGNPNALRALYQWAQGRFPYVEPMAQAKDHVHVSFRR